MIAGFSLGQLVGLARGARDVCPGNAVCAGLPLVCHIQAGRAPEAELSAQCLANRQRAAGEEIGKKGVVKGAVDCIEAGGGFNCRDGVRQLVGCCLIHAGIILYRSDEGVGAAAGAHVAGNILKCIGICAGLPDDDGGRGKNGGCLLRGKQIRSCQALRRVCQVDGCVVQVGKPQGGLDRGFRLGDTGAGVRLHVGGNGAGDGVDLAITRRG